MCRTKNCMNDDYGICDDESLTEENLEKMTTKQRYEKMFVTVHESALDDPNHESAIEDMNEYIERMGGTTHAPDIYETGMDYSWTVPANWTFRFYERFKSFGLKARVLPGSHWFGFIEN